MSKRATNILLLSLSGIGNFLMQSPTLRLLKQTRPSWHLTVWVAPKGTKELAENDSNVDALIEAPIQASPVRHIKTAVRLSQGKFDIGIMLSPGQLVKGAIYLYLAGIPKRIGHSYPFLGNPRSNFLLTDAIEEKDGVHDIEQNLRLLKLLDITNDRLQTADYSFDIPPDSQAKARALMQALSIPSRKKLIGLHAGSAPDFLWKRWPLENFITVGKVLTEKLGAHILILGGPDERDVKQQLYRSLHPHASMIAASLLTTAAIMQRCQLVLSNDSGLMHLAAAVGVKTFGLFGPTDEKKTGPCGIDSRVIRAPGTRPVYHTEKNYGLGLKPHVSLQAITPTFVFKHIEKPLSESY
jgi:heptosyltransferase II